MLLDVIYLTLTIVLLVLAVFVFNVARGLTKECDRLLEELYQQRREWERLAYDMRYRTRPNPPRSPVVRDAAGPAAS